MFTYFQKMKNPDGSQLGQREVFAESMNVVAAGADTTVSNSTGIVLKFLN